MNSIAELANCVDINVGEIADDVVMCTIKMPGLHVGMIESAMNDTEKVFSAAEFAL